MRPLNSHENYWLETLQSSADEHGVILTQEQAELMARDLEGSRECMGMMFGEECIPNPSITEKQKADAKYEALKAEMNRNIAIYESHIASKYRGTFVDVGI